MAEKSKTKSAAQADTFVAEGLARYREWQLEQAVESLRKAIRLDSANPDHHLNLAAALARAGDYDQALQSVADFLSLEAAGPVASRFQQMLTNALDRIESILTEKMTASGMSLEAIGAALQMWLEFRISMGRQHIVKRAPQAWAAALDYTVRKVNFRDRDLTDLARQYGTTARTIMKRHKQIVQTLDIMPCDYRYFVGQDNPLDLLVEAATMLEELEHQFSEAQT